MAYQNRWLLSSVHLTSDRRANQGGDLLGDNCRMEGGRMIWVWWLVEIW